MTDPEYWGSDSAEESEQALSDAIEQNGLTVQEDAAGIFGDEEPA